MELVEALDHYLYLHTLDLSYNKIEGAFGGKAIAKLLERSPESHGGIALKDLNLSHNKVGNIGFSIILESLALPNKRIEYLNMNYNDIKLLVGKMFETNYF